MILDVAAHVPHVFQAFAPVLDEGAAALDRAATFVRAHTGPGPDGRAGTAAVV